MKRLEIFFAFTRPHTIIGSAISVATLYFVASWSPSIADPLLWLGLVSALGCNIFITGYNQVVDVALDKINKPDLPIASGALSSLNAKIIVWTSLTLSFATAALVSRFLMGLIAFIALLGFLYSWKGVFLKKHHGSAAMAITIVRGVLVNVGFYLVFSGSPLRLSAVIPEIWLLTIFVSLFSLGIAWFKDIPDVKGDQEAQLGSLAIRAGIKRTFSIGFYTVASAYVIAAFAPLIFAMPNGNSGILCLGHAFLGLAFVSIAYRCDPTSEGDIKWFYKMFWVLFFFEYVLFAAAFWL